MLAVIVIFAILSSASCENFLDSIRSHPLWSAEYDQICGESYTDRIIGGRNAELGQYPWIARIFTHIPKIPYYYLCSGSLVTDQFIITAAHCVYVNKQNININAITLGDWNAEADPDCVEDICADPIQIFRPGGVFRHELYVEAIHKHDIAVIKLDKKAAFTEWVLPICLPFGDVDKVVFEYGEWVDIAGWGYVNSTTQKSPSILQTLKEPIVPISICNDSFYTLDKPDPQLDSRRQICAGGRKGYDSCNGDSGGPLMKIISSPIGVKYFLLGVVSYGSYFCGIGQPGVYTRISAYTRFILNALST